MTERVLPNAPLPDRAPGGAPGARRPLFAVAGGLCLLPGVTPPVALAMGILLALTIENPFAAASKKWSKLLLQGCVVLLGFGMNLGTVLRTGRGGSIFAAATIFTTLALGWLLGRLLKIAPRTSLLISAGTAICGGSAIAAVGSVIGGEEAEMTVALGTVFVLNAVALYLFPILGHRMHLSQTQFGVWAGVAIHDVSSVVGAASRYGLPALQIATAVKLSRALWIVPVSIGAALAFGYTGGTAVSPEGKRPNLSQIHVGIPVQIPLQIPWFIALFVVASVMRSFIPVVATVSQALTHLATVGLTLTLFLIGAGLSRQTILSVGWRPMLQGMILWAFISSASLLLILRTLH